MGEAGAFMVIDVRESEIRTVADGGDLGVALEYFADEGMGAGDAFFGASDEADGACIGDDSDVLGRSNLTLDLFEDGSMATKEGLVGFSARVIPILKGVGLLIFDLMDFAFDGDDPVGQEGGLMEKEGFLEALPRTARGDYPRDGGRFASLGEPQKKVRGEGSGGIFACEGAIEIGANEERLQWGRLNS